MACAVLLLLALLLLSADAALPTSFNTSAYNLTLTVPSDTTVGSNLTGSVVMTLLCVSETTNVTFHWGSSLLPSTPTTSNISMTVTASSLSSTATFTVAANSTDNTVTLMVTSPSSITAGETIDVTISYQTTVAENLRGVFFRNFSNGDGTNSSFIGTRTWPMYARNILPCLDEPRYNASWNVTLVAPTSWGVASSLNLTYSVANSTSGMTNYTYVNSSSLPPNLLSFFLSADMTNTNYTRGDYATPLSFWTRSTLNGTQLSNNISYLSDYYYMVDDVLSTNFTLSELMHIVLVPDLEMPFSSLGIVYIREDAYNESYSRAQDEGMFRTRELPVLREFLRQYCGFSTRPNSWADYWVTEAAAGYLEALLLAQVSQPFDLTPDLEVVARQSALALDTTDSAPLQDTSVDPTYNSTVLMSISDPLKRTKGAFLMNMLDLSFPAGLVYTSIKTLIREFKGAEVNSSQFFSLINDTVQSSGSFLSNGTSAALRYFPLWFNTSGYPLINATSYTAGSPGTVNLSMSVFCGNSSCSGSLVKWYASVTVGSRTEPRYSTVRQGIWVTNSSDDTTASLNIDTGDWLATNMRSSGYYRAGYNSSDWAWLLAALEAADGEVVGRSQLLDDAFAFSAASLLSYNTSLALAVANQQETLFRNWYPVRQGLWDIRDKLWSTDQYSTFKTFTTALLKNVDSLLSGGTLDPSQQAKIASLFWDGMCEMNVNNYRTYAKANLTSLLQGIIPTTVYSGSLDSMVCCGAEHTTSLSASTLWNSLANFSSSHYTKRFNAVALGCLSNFTAVSSLFATMIVASPQYNPYVLTTLQYLALQQPGNLSTSLPSVATTLQTKLGADNLAAIIKIAGKKLNSTQATTLSTALNATTVDDTVKRVAAMTMTAATLKTSWLSSYNASLVSALTANTVSAVASAATTPLSPAGALLLSVAAFTVAALI